MAHLVQLYLNDFSHARKEIVELGIQQDSPDIKKVVQTLSKAYFHWNYTAVQNI